MKKKVLFRTLIALFTLTLFQVGCQKEPIGKHPTFDNEKSGLTAPCDSILPGSTVLELMENPNDAEDTRINYVLYHYAQAVRKAASDSTKLCLLVNTLLATEGGLGTAALLELAENNPTPFGNGLNADLKLSILAEEVYPIEEPGIDSLAGTLLWDANAYLREKGSFEEDDLDEPVIYFLYPPNSCDLERDVIILIGTDVDDCDDVAGWKGNDEIVMSENEVRMSDDIIIFVGMGQRAPITHTLVDPKVHEFSSDLVSERADIDIDVDEYRIKKRFENSNKSEIMGKWTFYDPSAGFVEANGIPSDFDKHKIHKDHIGPNGTLFTNDKEFFAIPNVNWSIQVAAYEHDWFACSKDIKNTCITPPDNDYNMGGKRKYSHEIYFNECVIPASTWFPSVNDTKTFNNDASTFKFKRRN